MSLRKEPLKDKYALNGKDRLNRLTFKSRQMQGWRKQMEN
jgi:hypothetical protein